jgi:hypothetical protein
MATETVYATNISGDWINQLGSAATGGDVDDAPADAHDGDATYIQSVSSIVAELRFPMPAMAVINSIRIRMAVRTAGAPADFDTQGYLWDGASADIFVPFTRRPMGASYSIVDLSAIGPWTRADWSNVFVDLRRVTEDVRLTAIEVTYDDGLGAGGYADSDFVCRQPAELTFRPWQAFPYCVAAAMLIKNLN